MQRLAGLRVPITGYARLVGPRTAYVIVSFADGTTRRLSVHSRVWAS